jgi:hypothetical protein
MTPVLETFAPVTLERLDEAVALRVRSDHKHVVDTATLDAFLAALADTHAALDIGGRREFTYDSVYFDTEALLTARAHVQQRRRRFKCRSRLYVDTSACAFELKLKSARGETVKHRIPYAPADHGTITAGARAFLGEHVRDVPHLVPALRTVYTRSTLAGPRERVTIDRDPSFGSARLRSGWAIVETKSEDGSGIADRVLRGLGVRPLPLSKYLIGTGLTRMSTPPNDTRRLVKRYFADA